MYKIIALFSEVNNFHQPCHQAKDGDASDNGRHGLGGFVDNFGGSDAVVAGVGVDGFVGEVHGLGGHIDGVHEEEGDDDPQGEELELIL
jgi:hypothetical protein